MTDSSATSKPVSDTSDTAGELLPCPFCGGKAAVEELIGIAGGTAFSAGCNSEYEDDTGLCMGYQSVASFSRRSEAIAAWNRRTPPYKPGVMR